jgi:hypothetical protein
VVWSEPRVAAIAAIFEFRDVSKRYFSLRFAAESAPTEMKEILILRGQNLLHRQSFDEKLLQSGGAASSAMPTWRPPGEPHA